ncbi:MAG: NUDIX hydrolase [Candidatus Omnitrophota bacterium]|jgi:hypothetical protein|nr:MAG: NUDIX hydrolase [Candidatus Omnitrophota bacterium]
MKVLPTEIVSRRDWLQRLPQLLIPALSLSCMGGGNRSSLPKTKVAPKYHWARRENWLGSEMVFGVVLIGDRYLMVKRTDGMGWAFPGGPVNPKIHGEKSEKNRDLITAVTEYTHSQALVPVVVEDSVLLAYGYAIDELFHQTLMVHWYIVAIPSTFPPKVHPNMRDSQEARWVALDDPVLGGCLRERIEEYVIAGEGGTIIMKPCIP